MDQPIEIAFHNMDASDTLRDLIEARAEKMQRYFSHVTSCHVVVQIPHRSPEGTPKGFHVRIEARVPGKEIVVSRNPGNADLHDAHQAVNAAFDAMDRRLEQFSQTVRGDVKTPATQPQGRVRQLFPEYGFISTTDGRDIWFHRAAVLDDGFDKLAEGMPVELAIVPEGDAGMGPQATTVRPIGPMELKGLPPDSG